MALPFFNHTSDNVLIKVLIVIMILMIWLMIQLIWWFDLIDFTYLINACVKNIYEFYSTIKSLHGSVPCNLETCQIRLIFERLEKYLDFFEKK